MDYLFHVITITAMFGILATSLDLLVGRLGMVSLAHAALFGTGAYVAGIAAKTLGWAPSLTLPAATIASASLASLVAVVAARLRGDFFVIGTFALQMVFLSVVTNWVDVTGGPTGIPAIPHPEAMNSVLRPSIWSASVALMLLGLTLFSYQRVDKSPVARGLLAVRDSERFARSVGLGPLLLKVKAAAISGGIAGLVGAGYAYYTGFIAPSQFVVGESILLLTMVILGGANSVLGPALGAVLLTVIPEGLRFLGLPGSIAGNIRQILYGSALLVLVLWWPKGLLGRYEFEL
jgi:branched-chain amino acid transport system permease protein